LLAKLAQIRCKLEPQELEERLKLAWTAIRYEDSAIACEVDKFYQTYGSLQNDDVEE
jgi:hypothetical protein